MDLLLLSPWLLLLLERTGMKGTERRTARTITKLLSLFEKSAFCVFLCHQRAMGFPGVCPRFYSSIPGTPHNVPVLDSSEDHHIGDGRWATCVPIRLFVYLKPSFPADWDLGFRTLIGKGHSYALSKQHGEHGLD